jgi:uncharacterized protein YjbJ (UPF0337 family)
MSGDRIEGTAKQGLGRLQDAAGGLLGDDKTQMKGKLNEAAGSIQDAYGQIKGQASDAVDQARDVYAEIEDFARDQPATALAAAIGIGLVLGLLLRGGRKTVYVRK